MKKTVIIGGCILLFLMAIAIGIIIAFEIVTAIDIGRIVISQGFEDYITTLFWNTITNTVHHFVAFVLLIVNAFFIMFDFYFKDPLFRFQEKMKASYETKLEKIKANREIRRKKSKQKKYDKLKSKIEKMESDE